jgi:hypothetical protein
MKSMSLTLSLVTLSSLVLSMTATAGDFILRRECREGSKTRVVIAKLTGRQMAEPRDMGISENPLIAEVKVTESHYVAEKNGEGEYENKLVEKKSPTKPVIYPGEERAKLQAQAKSLNVAKVKSYPSMMAAEEGCMQIIDTVEVDGRSIQLQFAGAFNQHGQVDLVQQGAEDLREMLNYFDSQMK